MLSAILALIALVLAWEPSEHATGYRLYYGLAPTQYSTVLEVGSSTSASLDGLEVGQTYYFAATAYNEAGESGSSNEVVCEVRQNPKSPCHPSNERIPTR